MVAVTFDGGDGGDGVGGTTKLYCPTAGFKMYYDNVLQYEFSASGLTYLSRVIVDTKKREYTTDQQGYITNANDRLSADNVCPV